MSNGAKHQIKSFDNVERVVAEPIKLKVKLAIGDDAYASLRFSKSLRELWDVGGAAASGAAVASSATVATTFFASGGWLSVIGLGAAATTPIGWVIGAAVVSGGAYFGVMRLFRGYADSRVQKIPAFINSPIDLLGASLFDLMGALAIKVAEFGGTLDDAERQCLKDYFVDDWGLDRTYVTMALPVIEENCAGQSLRAMASTLADFQRKNPDCNYESMHRGLISFLREIAEADRTLDEREELGIEKIDQILAQAGRSSLASAVGAVVGAPGKLIRSLMRKSGTRTGA